MKKRMAVVLAAGKGTRMKSDLYKVLHPVNGLPMIEHVLRTVEGSRVDQIVTIVGHGAETVKDLLGNRSDFALQEEQLGTGHAVLQAKDLLGNLEGSTLVICGDTPLLTTETITELFDFHESQKAAATILSTIISKPHGYGRVVREADQAVSRIVEEKDATPAERTITEINTGTYVFDNQALFNALKNVTNENSQGEYYLPDVIGLLKQADKPVTAYTMANADEAIGVNDRVALAEASQVMSRRIIENHMRNGVTIVNPLNTYIEADVEIGSDTVIESGVSLKGKTVIGSHGFIGANTEIVDSRIADHVSIKQSVIEESTVETGVTVGPFAHLRPNAVLKENAHIGNFVEVKNSTVGKNTKAGHLSYIGDTDLGEDVNIGSGTAFVNYDGKQKFRSTVDNKAFIGCNTSIISPVHIGKKVFVGAGSTITKDVPDEALALGRARQENIPDYWQRFINK